MSPMSMLMRSTPSVTRLLRVLIRKTPVSDEVHDSESRVGSYDFLIFYESGNSENDLH
jgi:hypothetical protein